MAEPTIRFNSLCEIQAASDGTKKPTFSVVAYSGEPMSITGWGLVLIDVKGADVSGLIPVLTDHQQDLDSIAGQGQATIRDGRIIVDGVLTVETTGGRRVVALAKAGIVPQCSVGFSPTKTEHVQGGQTAKVNQKQFTAPERGLTVVRAGKLREISFVAVGADSGSQVAISAKGQTKMNEQSNDDPARNELGGQLPENAAGLSGVEKIQARWGRERWHDPTGLPHGRAEKALIAASAGRLPYADFERVLLEERVNDSELAMIYSSLPRHPGISSPAPRTSTPAVLEAALLKRMGHEALAEKTLGANTLQAAADLRCTSIMDVIKASFTLNHRDIPSSQSEMIRAGFSTNSLAGVLGSAANKILEQAYSAFPSVARVVARRLSANDFKVHTGYRLDGGHVFEEVGPSGEIKHGNLAESSFTFRVATYAKMFGITRQDVVNDDLSAFDELPRILGRGAALALESAFWTLVLANTSSYFAGGNSNYISGATTALSIEGLRQAVQKIRQQVDADANPVLVQPMFLVAPPELEATADALYASTNVVVAGATDVVTPDGNPYKNKYQPLVVPYLSNDAYSGYSATAWYLFGSPADVAAFGIAYLNSQASPTIETADADFNVLGQQYRGFLDFGVCQVDHRGAVKSAGA